LKTEARKVTDKTGFSMGMTVNPAVGFKPLPDLVVLDQVRAYPVNDGNLLLHNTRNGKRAMVKPEVYASLLLCDQLKTMDKHAEAIIERNPGMQGQEASIRDVLQTMLNSGMMISAKNARNELIRKIDTQPGEKEYSAPVVAILTWERPQALERLLESITANCETGSLHRIYVIDDSRKSENIALNQELTSRFSSKISAPLQYFGRSEQQSLVDELVKQLPEHEDSINFLANHTRWRDHWTAGLSRNLALLLSCGRRLVMMDDDAICEVYDPPRPKRDVTFSDDPREAAFFGNEQEWAHLKQPLNPDPIKRHMQCLGMTFSEAMNELGLNHLKPAGFANATALQLSELNTESAVLVTECGSLGCPGSINNTWLPGMAETSLKTMLTSQEKTTQALTSRKVWSGRNQPHFAPRSNMSQITGFDNREMLPPYLPILRGQDRLFGQMLDFIIPKSLVLDYPWAIPHLPIPDRQWRDRDLNFKPADSFPKFFVEKINEFKASCLSTSPTDRLLTLASWFKSMSSTDADTLTAMYIDSRLRRDSDLLQQLNTLLAQAETAPVNWQNYLRNGITQLNSDLNLVSREDFEVKGLPATLDSDALVSFWKGVWGEFAAAIKAWPQIRDAAKTIVSSM
jgi:hypothetical protein